MSKESKNLKEETKEGIPLNVILKFIKPFDGSREKLNAFTNNCDNAISLASSYQVDIVFKYIISQLDGKAEIACSIKEFDSWTSLKDFLQKQFGERKHYAHLLAELQDCRQSAQENVNQFSLRIETCLSQLLTEISLTSHKKNEIPGRVAAMEDLALHTFTMGLTPRIANIVRCRDPKNLNDAINYAISEEKLQQYSYKQTLAAKSFRHNDPNIKPNKSNSSNNDQSQKPALQQTSSNDPFCRYCKKSGHILEKCTLREYNNKKYNQNKSFTSNAQPSTSTFKPRINVATEVESRDTVDNNLN